jgi:amino acid adenylation domain-containing protein
MMLRGFERSLREGPGRSAIRFGARVWSYAEVDEIRRGWASAIQGICRGRCARVAMFSYRSFESLAAPLAILSAGAAFVPLNPSFPVERTRTMIARAGVDAIVCDAASVSRLVDVLRGFEGAPPVVVLAGDATPLERAGATVLGARAAASAALFDVAEEASADSLAYVLFTSGSTGEPKGVPISHGNARAFLDHNREYFRFGPGDRFSQTFDQTFDLSIFDLFMAWEVGGCVCGMTSIELLAPFRYARENGITVWFSVPSLAAMLDAKGMLIEGALPGLRAALFCGEALPLALARRFQRAAPRAVVENLYGPTELTIACASFRLPADIAGDETVGDLVPIGHVYDGLSACLLAEQPLAIRPGREGELCVAGAQTFRGHLGVGEGAPCFCEGPRGDEGRVYYRTGDRVRVLASGALAYLGRVDHQIKVNGYRVELGEIESAMRAADGVSVAVAVPWPLEAGSARGIVGFVQGDGVDAAGVVHTVRERLPSYMVPRALHVVAQWPLNANGKIDRRALASWLDGQRPGADR